MSINIDKMIFVGLTEMEKYCGEETNLSGGGSFIEREGFGHELYNFKEDNGFCYGYSTPYGKLDLHRISDEHNTNAHGSYVDNVLVVFTGTREGKGRVIVGWYQDARVYGTIVKDKRQARYLNSIQDYVGYNLVSRIQDSFLIAPNDRVFIIPHSRANNGVGHGQHNVWYADQEDALPLKTSIIKYVCDFGKILLQNSEIKYHLHNENKPHVTTSTQITRSQRARNECIEIHGCRCNICNFDFEKMYGSIGKDYIEVHHITPIGQLSSAEGYTGTNPKNDLIPLCSNCHSMIHRKRIPYLPDEIRGLIKLNSAK